MVIPIVSQPSGFHSLLRVGAFVGRPGIPQRNFGFCHSPVDIRASVHVGVSGSERQ